MDGSIIYLFIFKIILIQGNYGYYFASYRSGILYEKQNINNYIFHTDFKYFDTFSYVSNSGLKNCIEITFESPTNILLGSTFKLIIPTVSYNRMKSIKLFDNDLVNIYIFK